VIILAVVLIAAVSTVVVYLGLRPRYYSTTVELNAVTFPDAEHAWVAGDRWGDDGIDGGIVHATSDGGATWEEQKSGAASRSSWALAFADANCGWLLCSTGAADGPPGVLFATTDGGATWERQATDSEYYLVGVDCVSATHAWAVGTRPYPGGGVILATQDGGSSWETSYVSGSAGLWSVAFADARHGWAVGDGVIVATADGGATWSEHAVNGCSLRDVAAGDGRHAWAVGLDGDADVILATADGATWTRQYSRKATDPTGRTVFFAVAFPDARHGWVVGLDGMILATSDGGRSWASQRSGTDLDLRDVAFADAEHGLAVGDRYDGESPLSWELEGSIILRTTDGGVSWEQ